MNPSTRERPTKRAPDAGDSGAIPSLFLRLSIFPVGRLPPPAPARVTQTVGRWRMKAINQEIINQSSVVWLQQIQNQIV